MSSRTDWKTRRNSGTGERDRGVGCETFGRHWVLLSPYPEDFLADPLVVPGISGEPLSADAQQLWLQDLHHLQVEGQLHLAPLVANLATEGVPAPGRVDRTFIPSFCGGLVDMATVKSQTKLSS